MIIVLYLVKSILEKGKVQDRAWEKLDSNSTLTGCRKDGGSYIGPWKSLRANNARKEAVCRRISKQTRLHLRVRTDVKCPRKSNKLVHRRDWEPQDIA